MTDRKYYLWLIPGVLVFGMVLTLVLTFQPVLAGSEQVELNSRGDSGLQSISVNDEAAFPQAEVDPACTLDTTDAISHWPLDEESDTTFYDALAGNHDGTCSGDSCPTPISGTNAVGQFFISTDTDAITVGSHADFNFLATESFSVGIWVKTTQICTGNKVFIGRYGSAYSEGRWWLGCEPGSTPGEGVARFHMRDSNYVNVRRATGTTRINDGKWHYLTGVWDGTDTLLYVDGVEEARVSSPIFNGNFNSARPLTIGAFHEPIDYYVTGALDEAAVFSTALSESFIDDYLTTGCNFQGLDVRDVTFDMSNNVAIEISAAELLDGSSGAGALSIADRDGTSEKVGTITGTVPDGPFIYTLPNDYVGTDFFTFVISDGVNTARGTAIITQETPNVTNPGPQVDIEGAAVSLQIEVIDPNGDDLTYQATGLPSALSIDANSGLISGNIAAGAAGSYDPVTVTVTDEKGFSSQVEFTWTITVDGNLPPVVVKPDDQVNKEGETGSLQVQASDPNGDQLAYTALGLPSGLSIHPTSGLISGKITAGASGFSPYTVTVRATDTGFLFDEETFTWTVTSNNIFLPLVLKP